MKTKQTRYTTKLHFKQKTIEQQIKQPQQERPRTY